MDSWTFVSRDPDETRAIGRELGRSIGADGLVIALVGPLGAGKTVFVKGLAEGLGVDPRSVSSPTFVIAQQYPVPEGPDVLHHVDLYRLESPSELETIGFDDMFAPGSVLAVEWADRFPGVLGREFLHIEFDGPQASELDHEDAEHGTSPPPARVSASPGRGARVRAEGQDAARVSKDWFERVERLQDMRSGVGPGGPAWRERHVIGAFLLAGALSLGAVASPSGTALESCAALVTVAADELGSLRVRCVRDSERADDGSALCGIGLLLEGERLDVNRADAALLETLPGIGPARASAIEAGRRDRPYDSLHGLERVSGIGPATRAKLEAWLRITDAPNDDRAK